MGDRKQIDARRTSGRPRGLESMTAVHHPAGAADPGGPIAYAGEPGAFAEDAVLAAFPDAQRSAVPGFAEVFAAVVDGDATLGVVPIENLVNGTVRETYDLLLRHDLEIVGEIVVPVRLCLAALPGQTLDQIERVYSHIQALGQAEPFLRQRHWTLLTTYNTAGAGKLIVERGERGAAAVLSPRAAAGLGLEVLAEGIEEVPDNRTRFLVLARPGAAVNAALDPAGAPRAAPDPARGPAPRSRTTLVFGVRNEPGTLLQALATFARRGLNLSKLESRPSRGAAWEYVFWADLDGSVDEPSIAEALAELRTTSTMVRVLGSYPRAGEP
jgi:prephenate dehydratase